jgi:hypothetical protein
MAEDKKISAKEAGIAVLKKFVELSVKASVMAKSVDLKKDEVPETIPGGTTINTAIGSPFGKGEEQKEIKGHHKLAKFIGYIHGKRSAKQGSAAIVDAGNDNPAKPIKADLKELDKSATGHEKGINTQSDPSQKSKVMLGTSQNGSQMPSKNPADIAEAKEGHKQVLGEMKNIKPKLPG